MIFHVLRLSNHMCQVWSCKKIHHPNRNSCKQIWTASSICKNCWGEKTDHENEMSYTNLHLSPHLLRSPQLIHSPFMMCFGPLTIITPKNNQIALFNPPPPSRWMPPMSCGINNKISKKNSSSPHELLRSPPTIITPKTDTLLPLIHIHHLAEYHQCPVQWINKNEKLFLIPSWFASFPRTIVTPKNREIASIKPHPPSRRIPPLTYTNNNKNKWIMVPHPLMICFCPPHHHHS